MGGQIKKLKAKAINKHETEANWNLSNYIPDVGEIVFYDIDEAHNYIRQKNGDGIHRVKDLPFTATEEELSKKQDQLHNYSENYSEQDQNNNSVSLHTGGTHTFRGTGVQANTYSTDDEYTYSAYNRYGKAEIDFSLMEGRPSYTYQYNEEGYENGEVITKHFAFLSDIPKDSGYDLVVESDDDFDQCLYPLYKDEEILTRDQAARKVTDDNAFNTPNPEFTARRVLVKGVTFTKMRGYDDVRLHIFQPSIEYIKFDNCRWETHWKVSGKNPRDPSALWFNMNAAPERATAFNRATDPLTLTIEGVHLTEQNVIDAPANPITWGVGFRNIKIIKNCHIDYPKNYKLTSEGYRTLEMSCQFFDFADNCSISGLWDGTNVTNCRVNKILKRCTNVANIEAVNLPNQSGTAVSISAENCHNMVNLKGQITFSSCVGITASREDAQGYANTAEENAKNYTDEIAENKVDIGTPSPFSEGAMVYAQLPNGNLGFVHARTGYNVNEIVMRDNKRLTYARPSDYYQTIAEYYDNASAACGKWPKSALMPRDYIDKLVKGDTYGNNGYAPLNYDKKIDAKYLPPYAPLVGGKVPVENLPFPSSYDIVITSQEQFLVERNNFANKKILIKDAKFSLTEIDFNGAAYIEFCNSHIGNLNCWSKIKNFSIGNFASLFWDWNDDENSYGLDTLYIEDFGVAENLIINEDRDYTHDSGYCVVYHNGYGVINCLITSVTNCCNISNCHVVGRYNPEFINCCGISNLHIKGYQEQPLTFKDCNMINNIRIEDSYINKVTFENCAYLSNLSFSDVEEIMYINCSNVDSDTCDGYVSTEGAGVDKEYVDGLFNGLSSKLDDLSLELNGAEEELLQINEGGIVE